MLRKNKTSRSPLSTPSDLSSPVDSRQPGPNPKLSTSPTIVLEPSPPSRQTNQGGGGGMSSSSSFLSLHRFLGPAAQERDAGVGSSNSSPTSGSGSASVTTSGPGSGQSSRQHLTVPQSGSSGSGWKGFNWFSSGSKSRGEASSSRSDERAGFKSKTPDEAGNVNPSGVTGSGNGKRSPRMSKGVISGPSNFVHRENGTARMSTLQGGLSPGSTSGSRSPESLGLTLIESTGSRQDPLGSDAGSSPGRTWGRRATVGSPQDRAVSPLFDRSELPPVPPLPPVKSPTLSSSSSSPGLPPVDFAPTGGQNERGTGLRISTDLLRGNEGGTRSASGRSTQTLGGLGATAKRPWARSVDDLSKMLGMDKKPKNKALLGGLQKESIVLVPGSLSTGPSSAGLGISTTDGSPVISSSPSMASFPVSPSLGSASARQFPGVTSSSSTPTSDVQMRPHTPVASVPISDGSGDVPLGRKKSREMVSQLMRSNSRESLSNVLTGGSSGKTGDEPTGRKRGARRKTNSFSGKMLLDVVHGATGLIKGKDHDTENQNLPRQTDRQMNSGGKASSPAIFYGSTTTQVDSSTVGGRSGNINTKSKPHHGHGRSQSFNLLGGISIGTKTPRDRQRSGQPDVGRTRDGDQLGLRSEEGGLIRTPSGNAKRSSQVIHKEGFLLKHNPAAMRNGRTGRTPSPSVIKGLGEDYFSFKKETETSRNWKPHKVVIRGTKLHLYKPPSDKRIGIESLFPTVIVQEIESPTANRGGLDTTPKHGRRPAQRVFWGTTQHPDLKVKPGTATSPDGRIAGGSLEALAHELIFATQFTETGSDVPDMAAYKVFLVTVLLAHRGRTELSTLFSEMDKCLRRAIDAEETSVEAFASRIRVMFEILVDDFRIDRVAESRPLSPIVQSLLDTGSEFRPERYSGPHPAEPERSWRRGGASPESNPSMIRLADLALETVANALSSMMSEEFQHLELGVSKLDETNFGEAQVGGGIELFYSHGLHPKTIGSACLQDVLAIDPASQDLTHRHDRLVAWVQLADICRSRGNYATFISIAQALHSPPILRLDRLWNLVSEEVHQTMSSWQALAGKGRAGSLPFHSPVLQPASVSAGSAAIPFLGSRRPVAGESLSDWQSLAIAWLSNDRDRPVQTPLEDGVRSFLINTYDRLPTSKEPMSHWMDLSRRIHPSHLGTSIGRSWSRAEGRYMAALQPLLYTTPLPINTMFAASSLLDTPTAAMARPEARRPPSLLDTGRSARRISMPSRRSSYSENSSHKARDGEATEFDAIGNAVRRITGQLHNATIRITDEIELQIIEPEAAASNSLPLSRTNSRARSSLALDLTGRLGLGATLPVTVKHASSERLIDLLICGIEGDSLGSDDNGQMPLNFSFARKFAMDLEIYRRTFFATYRSFLEPTLLFESLKKRFYRAGEAVMPVGADLPSAALQWLTGATSSASESSRSESLACFIRTQVVELLCLWRVNGDELRSALDDAELLSRMAEFVSETENVDSGTRTEEEHVIVESIRDWWTALTDQILGSTRCGSPVTPRTVSPPILNQGETDTPLDSLDLDVICEEPPSSAEQVLAVLFGTGKALAVGITATELHNVCGIIARQSRDPLGWYLCEVAPARSRQERHQVQISCPHRTFRQRLGAPAHGLPRFDSLLPSSVQTAIEGYERVRLWLVHGLIARSGRDVATRAAFLTALFEALAKSNHPETADKLEKRASIASLSALTASSNSITIPCFVEAVICDALLDPAVRLELDMWNAAIKGFMGRLDDLSSILSAARLRHSADARVGTTPDMAWLMRCLAEIVWSFPESPDFMVNFEKQRHIFEIVQVAAGNFASAYTPQTAFCKAFLAKLAGRAPVSYRAAERPSGSNFVLYQTLFGSLISQEIARQDREMQTIVQLLKHRGEAKTRMANKGYEYSAIMSKSANQKTPKAKKHVSDAFWWSSRPMSVSSKDLLSSASPGLARSAGSLEFKTPKESTLTLNLAGCQAKVIPSANRSFVFEIVSPEGLRHILQAKSRAELESWTDLVNKASEMALLRRKTFVEPTIIEVAEPLPLLPMRLTLAAELARDHGPEPDSNAIPLAAQACMAILEQKFLEEPGLYRIPGSLSRVDALVRQLVTGRIPDLSHDETYADPTTITSAFKKWLASMPESLVTDERYYDFILADKIPERNDRLYAIRSLIWSLPPANFALLHRVIQHLDLVNDHEEENQMTPRNLATCLAPTLFYPSAKMGGMDVAMQSIGHALNLVDTMICQRYWLFHNFESGEGVGSAPSSPMPVNDGFELPQHDGSAWDPVEELAGS